MASIQKRKNKNGTSHWRAVVRIKGYPTVCNHFDRKQEAIDWSQEVERQIKQGQYNFDLHKNKHTLSDLIDHFVRSGALEHHRSAQDTQRHLDYWRSRLGSYALVHINSDLLGRERLDLVQTPAANGRKRASATVNRYFASLSTLLTYASTEIKWITDNRCLSIKKLKENPGRDRVLTSQEISNLLEACKQSRSSYLYCIVLIALTTGARQGEILNLEWKQIDFENKLASLKETKNGRPRTIALSDTVLIELGKIFDQRNPLKPLVFASKTAFGRLDIKKAWANALNRSGISNCRLHDMRHTFAMAAAQGASNLVLATAMGRTLEMLQRYTHLDAQVTKKFTNKISDQILQGVPQ